MDAAQRPQRATLEIDGEPVRSDVQLVDVAQAGRQSRHRLARQQRIPFAGERRAWRRTSSLNSAVRSKIWRIAAAVRASSARRRRGVPGAFERLEAGRRRAAGPGARADHVVDEVALVVGQRQAAGRGARRVAGHDVVLVEAHHLRRPADLRGLLPVHSASRMWQCADRNTPPCAYWRARFGPCPSTESGVLPSVSGNSTGPWPPRTAGRTRCAIRRPEILEIQGPSIGSTPSPAVRVRAPPPRRAGRRPRERCQQREVAAGYWLCRSRRKSRTRARIAGTSSGTRSRCPVTPTTSGAEYGRRSARCRRRPTSRRRLLVHGCRGFHCHHGGYGRRESSGAPRAGTARRRRARTLRHAT